MLKLELITPERVALTETVYEIMLPTQNGQITLLPGHMPLITLLQPGVITIRRQKGDTDRQLEHLATSGGFVQVADNHVKVMADTAERADDINELKIEEAKTAARQQLAQAKDDVAYADAVSRLEAELARAKVKNLKHRHSGSARLPENSQ